MDRFVPNRSTLSMEAASAAFSLNLPSSPTRVPTQNHQRPNGTSISDLIDSIRASPSHLSGTDAASWMSGSYSAAENVQRYQELLLRELVQNENDSYSQLFNIENESPDVVPSTISMRSSPIRNPNVDRPTADVSRRVVPIVEPIRAPPRVFRTASASGGTLLALRRTNDSPSRLLPQDLDTSNVSQSSVGNSPSSSPVSPPAPDTTPPRVRTRFLQFGTKSTPPRSLLSNDYSCNDSSPSARSPQSSALPASTLVPGSPTSLPRRSHQHVPSADENGYLARFSENNTRILGQRPHENLDLGLHLSLPECQNRLFRSSLGLSSLSLASSTATRNTPVAKQSQTRNYSPYRILDAPGLIDDFYFNLLDWSAMNTLAVALGNSVFLWNSDTGVVTRLLTVRNDIVTSLAWSQTGRALAVGTGSGSTQLWDPEAGTPLRVFDGHSERVASLAWGGNVLTSGSGDKSILLRDARLRDAEITRYRGHTQEICGLAWSPDWSVLASGANDNTVRIWSVAMHRSESGASTPSCTHSNSPMVVTGKGECLAVYEHKSAVKALSWSPHVSGLLATGAGTVDKCIRFFQTATSECVGVINTGHQVTQIEWSRHSNEFVASLGFQANSLVVWNYPNLEQVAHVTGHADRILYMALSPDGTSICTGAGDETIRFWNIFPHSSVPEMEKQRPLLVTPGSELLQPPKLENAAQVDHGNVFFGTPKRKAPTHKGSTPTKDCNKNESKAKLKPAPNTGGSPFREKKGLHAVSPILDLR